ncbi:hypothetical protein IAD21_00572 [Abditibacteriota bacterium]|nr:hypothetical protein IAD21_00572 [Abditibacteriota bacterium]
MPLSAQQLADAASFSPDFFSADVIDPSLTEDEQKAQLLDYISSEVLPLANGEVEIPVRKALGDFTSALDNDGLTAMFGNVGSSVIALWDAAETSYGRSELNKRVNSDNAQRDTDSDQDRIQGNQRLQKLLEFVATWVALQPGSEESTETVLESTQGVETTFVW